MESLKCFVIMPFKKRFDKVYAEIKRTVKRPLYGVSLACKRLDQSRHPGPITDELAREILDSTVCVADLTGLNPNVMWEVGYAMALRKPVVAVTQDSLASLPFDLKDLKTIHYKTRGANLNAALGKPLRAALREALGKRDPHGPSTRAYRLMGIKHIMSQACHNAEAIRVPHQKIEGEPGYLRHLQEGLGSLRRGDELLALCGEKNWDSEGVRNYFGQNCRAVKRGVRVKRIFYLHEGARAKVMRAARSQARGGVEVKIIRPQAARALRGLHWVPRDLAFAIVGGKQVVVHVGAADTVKTSVYNEPGLVAQFRVLLDQLDAIARPLGTRAAARKRKETAKRGAKKGAKRGAKKAGASRAKRRTRRAARRRPPAGARGAP
ncbi:MAG: hypothetical protein ABR563_02110 [Pyrinomonadaceae bacterium]